MKMPRWLPATTSDASTGEGGLDLRFVLLTLFVAYGIYSYVQRRREYLVCDHVISIFSPYAPF